MKSLILKAFNFTFMIDGIFANTNEEAIDEQNMAFRMIFQYLNNPSILKELTTSLDDFAAFRVAAMQKTTILKNAAIDGRTIKGTVLGDNLSFDIDSLVTLDIRDFKIFDFKRVDPSPFKDNDGEIRINMNEDPEGSFVSIEDYQKLMQRVIELEMQG
jgi:hypothetical protein